MKIILPRRELIKKGLLTAGVTGLALMKSSAVFAQDGATEKAEEIVVSHEIGKNHGHAFDLSLIQALRLLRSTRQGEAVVIDIQGQSGHAHDLSLNFEDMLALFADGVIQKQSSLTVGHVHPVTLRLEIVKPPETSETL